MDFDSSGQVTIDSLLQVADLNGIVLNSGDALMIKDRYGKRTSISSMSAKVDYIRVLNDLKMQVNARGKIDWVLVTGKNVNLNSQGVSPYRLKIQQMIEEDSRNNTVDSNTKLHFLSKNHMRVNSKVAVQPNYITAEAMPQKRGTGGDRNSTLSQLNHNSVRKPGNGEEEGATDDGQSLEFMMLPKGPLNPIRHSYQHMTRQVSPVQGNHTTKYHRDASFDSAILQLPQIGGKGTKPPVAVPQDAFE